MVTLAFAIGVFGLLVNVPLLRGRSAFRGNAAFCGRTFCGARR